MIDRCGRQDRAVLGDGSNSDSCVVRDSRLNPGEVLATLLANLRDGFLGLLATGVHAGQVVVREN